MDHITRGMLKTTALRWSRVGNRVGGGSTVFGEAQTRSTAGGGRWRAEFEVILRDDDDVRAWEAMLLAWNNGDEKMVVHRHGGPLLLSQNVATPVGHSDGAYFSDDTPYVGGVTAATLVDPVAVRATLLKVRVQADRQLRGGEPFTIVGPKYADRLYGVARVLSSQVDGAARIYTIRTPPMREAFAAGTVVDFDNPRSVMRVQMTDELWPSYDVLFHGDVPVAFEETFR